MDRLTLNELAQTWLDTRVEMAAGYDDRLRWNRHWEPIIGRLDPDELTVPILKRGIVALRRKGLSKATVGLCVRLLSSFYGELVEEGQATGNPCRLLSKKTRAQELRSDHDRKTVPFVRDAADIPKIYQWLRPRYRALADAYAIGALAGLRTGEVRALNWDHVDMERRMIHVQQKVERPRSRPISALSPNGLATPKDDDSRWVPISDALYPILASARGDGEASGLVCPPSMGSAGRGRFIGENTMGNMIEAALAALGIEPMNWYQSTRHTFASQWILHGGSKEKLQEMLGHSSVTTTEDYAHLIPGRFTDADRARIEVTL
jgi:integrase